MSNLTPEQQIDAFWEALWNSWEIEPRSYFEEQAPRNGFGSPLAMAVHYMWKREVKLKDETVSQQVELARNEGAQAARSACIKIAKGFTDSSGYHIPQRIAEAIQERGNQL
jgi:hypothetical protein